MTTKPQIEAALDWLSANTDPLTSDDKDAYETIRSCLQSALTTPQIDGSVAAFEKRAADLTEWLSENAPYLSQDQKHLAAGSVERAYWHYGYLVALKDVISKLRGGE